MAEPLAPGLRFEVVPPPAAPEPLRSDVAAFAGATRRGPVGEPVRVAEWREYLRLFGGLVRGPYTPYAVRSYFENGGQVAWIVRLAGSVAAAAGVWPEPGGPSLPGHRLPNAPPGSGRAAFLLGDQAVTRFKVVAATPGAWAEGGRVTIQYRRQGVASGGPEVDLEVRVDGEPPEVLRGLPAADAADLAARVAALSRLVRLDPDAATAVDPGAGAGPNRLEWRLTLAGGAEAAPRSAEYLAAVEAMGEEREIALVALPDLHRDLPPGAAGPVESSPAYAVLRAAIADAERRHDRLVLVDLPLPGEAGDTLRALDELVAVLADPLERRAAAVYHPWLWVADPLGGTAAPRKLIPPSGSVAGLVSRLDRERGAHHTPANAPLVDALDSASAFDPALQGQLNARGLNLIRCFPNRGLQVWGGRTLGNEEATRFVAHRRLIHRLVRAIRRVAEPLVFEVEGPELWLTLVRGITTVLLTAFRAGALSGARPEEAFRVRCDETTNPPAERELGRVLCEIDVAPAAPMEFITLRVALGREGELEVFEP
jgi:hypothetical protein